MDVYDCGFRFISIPVKVSEGIWLYKVYEAMPLYKNDFALRRVNIPILLLSFFILSIAHLRLSHISILLCYYT